MFYPIYILVSLYLRNNGERLPIRGGSWSYGSSAGVFALAHLVLGNWQAPVLAWCGGLLFAWTYWRTRSLLLVTLEHGLWGNWLFTLGLGRYFYGGHI